MCTDGATPFDSTAGTTPCQGTSCDPEQCVPDPGDIDECKGDDVPASIMVRLDRAHRLLARMHGKKKGKGLSHAAVKQLDKAARLASRAADRGTLAGDCASALADALDSAGACAQCSQ
ncbi:MAG TPA: hypothetical protein VMS22_10570 [Candidatus Eisenbacteria bacterium]|nr:hypothetical protein [Candidatus Eisenbacteria bacterium]